MHLVARAERGALLPDEGRKLRDAIELLDELAMYVEGLAYGNGGMILKGYQPTGTQEMRLDDIRGMLADDDAPGRP